MSRCESCGGNAPVLKRLFVTYPLRICPVCMDEEVENRFSQIIDAIGDERDYQNRKFGNIEQNPHEIYEWLDILGKELDEAQQATAVDRYDDALREILQATAVGIACLEQHGIYVRPLYVFKLVDADLVIAHDEQDAVRLWEYQTGENWAEYDSGIIRLDGSLKIAFVEHDLDEVNCPDNADITYLPDGSFNIEASVQEWIKSAGPGILSSAVE